MGNAAAKGAEPVTIEKITDIDLRPVLASEECSATSTIKAGTLWQDKPSIVYVVRRPGCPLCREHALELTEHAAEIKALGVGLVGVVHEELGADIFAKEFFSAGTLYFDEKKAFFESMGSRWLGMQGLLYPSVHANARRAKAKKVDGNWKGEGRLLGGLLVVGAGKSGVVFEHREQVFGDHASMDDILAACRKAAGKENTVADTATSTRAAESTATTAH